MAYLWGAVIHLLNGANINYFKDLFRGLGDSINIVSVRCWWYQPRLDAWDKCSGLVHWEDPEGSGREGGGRGDRDGEYKEKKKKMLVIEPGT